MSKIKLGVRARDKVTGFKGIVIGQTQWLTGCDQMGLKPKADKDNKVQSAEWFDIGTVEFVDEGIHAKEVMARKNGGPQPDAPVK